MHDLLFENQPLWASAQSGLTVTEAAQTFEGYAQQLGLDMDQYRSDVESEATFDLISSHLDSGNQLGVTGTPTLFLNGEEITERSSAEIGSLIDAILAADQDSETSEE